MKYIFVRDHRGAFPVDLMCGTLGMGSSAFYAWLKRPESPRSQQNRTLKVDLIHGKIYNTRQKAKTAIFDYIEIFYNRQRRHSYLGYLSPMSMGKRMRLN
jgi:transposase InsO family protein